MQRFKGLILNQKYLIATSLLALVLAGCPANQGSESTDGSTSKTSRIGGSSGTLPVGNTEGSFITVNSVLRSNQDPNTYLELVGSNGQIGTQCANAKTDCQCEFTWTDSSGFIGTAVQEPAYGEANMLRCAFTQVPGDINNFKVAIKILAAGLSSNQINVYISAPNPSLDSSISANYLQVHRYMCRDLITKKNTKKYKSNLLDPALWDLSLTFNFYTTSFGLDYGATAVASSSGSVTTVPGYECPIVPNDTSDPTYDYKLYSLADVDISSPGRTAVPAGTGDNTIFPADDNKNLTAGLCVTGNETTCEKYILNRHDYYLATFQSGTFKYPVCVNHRVASFTAATLNCQIDSSKGAVTLGSAALAQAGQDIIGFAAMPDSAQNCPASVKLPAGKKWAKLWQFRTSFQQRTIQDVSNPNDIGDLFCTTRKKECKNSGVAPDGTNHSVCYDQASTSGGISGLGVSPSAVFSASSSLGFGNCDTKANWGDGYGPDAGGTYMGAVTGACSPSGASTYDNCCFDLDYTSTSGLSRNNVRPANFAPAGGDICNPALKGRVNATTAYGGIAENVWLKGNGNYLACLEADTDNNGKLASEFESFPPTGANPFRTAPIVLDDDPKYDIVYVVTPPSVTIEQMMDSTGAVAQQYTPFRANPLGGPIQTYRLYSNSLNVTDPAFRTSQYPICVIQDAKKGASGSL